MQQMPCLTCEVPSLNETALYVACMLLCDTAFRPCSVTLCLLQDVTAVLSPILTCALSSGHRKAVSYVRYLNGNELVSASTDSTLRLWDTQSCVNTRVFNGHSNEKNFVGLSVSDDFVSCGSETNEVTMHFRHSFRLAASCSYMFNT